MKLNLLTYADDLYRPMQAKLVEHAQSFHMFDHIYTRTRDGLINSEFYQENKNILDRQKGGGYCLWKPFYILETLARMEENDILVYMDSADWIINAEGFRNETIDFMANKDIVPTAGAFINSHYTKRDCFVYMGCDYAPYHDCIQIEAGVLIIKNTEYSRKIVAEWLKWCKVSSVITDDENICNLPNLDGFKEGRYDQSILTNICIKNSIWPMDFVRKFIKCNVNMPD